MYISRVVLCVGEPVSRGGAEAGLAERGQTQRRDLAGEDDGELEAQETDVVVEGAGDVAPHVVVGVDDLLLDLDELLAGGDGEEAVVPHQHPQLLHGDGGHAVRPRQHPLLLTSAN